MDKTHTPGPWVVVPDLRTENNRYSPDFGQEELVGYDISSESESIVSCEGILAGGNGEANARLIAAAPDLLEALRYAARFLRDEDHDTAFVRATIAKATGETL